MFKNQIKELIGIELIFCSILCDTLIVGLDFPFEFIVQIDGYGFGGFLWLFFMVEYFLYQVH